MTFGEEDNASHPSGRRNYHDILFNPNALAAR